MENNHIVKHKCLLQNIRWLFRICQNLSVYELITFSQLNIVDVDSRTLINMTKPFFENDEEEYQLFYFELTIVDSFRAYFLVQLHTVTPR